MVKYSIGIVTYNKRFEQYFKPLIKSIPSDIEIIVCVNGNYNETFDLQYKQEFLQFVSEYDNVYPMIFTTFRSLSKLWNMLVINSTYDNILILNDDIKIKSNIFFNELDNIITNDTNFFKINSSWSHFVVNKFKLNDLGWFDERFLSVGYEDTDAEKRFFKKYNKQFKNIKLNNIVNIVEHNNVLLNQQKVSKYSKFNENFYNYKYNNNISDSVQYPYEMYYWDNKEKL